MSREELQKEYNLHERFPDHKEFKVVCDQQFPENVGWDLLLVLPNAEEVPILDVEYAHYDSGYNIDATAGSSTATTYGTIDGGANYYLGRNDRPTTKKEEAKTEKRTLYILGRKKEFVIKNLILSEKEAKKRENEAKRKLFEKEKVITELNKRLKDRTDQVVFSQDRINELNELASDLKGKIKKKDQKINELSHRLKEGRIGLPENAQSVKKEPRFIDLG